MQSSIQPIALDEFAVRAGFSNLAVLQHDDAVGVFDGRQTVRDHEGRATFHEPFERGLHLAFGLRIQCGRRFVQDQDRRVFVDRACNRQALALDGNNEAARRGLESLSGLAVNQFNQALSIGNLAAANDRLADLADLSPGNTNQGELRLRLAGAWMDQAEQDLQNGNRANAARALENARKLAPGNPRLATLMARLSSGG